MKLFTTPPKDFNFNTQVSACCVHHQDKILILKYAAEKPFWAIPGGKQEPGEAPRETALRELNEETGISLSQNEITKVGQIYIRQPNLDYVFYMFRTQIRELKAISLSDEHADYKWATSEEFLSLPQIPGGREAFQHYQIFFQALQECKAVLDAQLIPIKNNHVLLSLRQNTGFCDGSYGLIAGKVDAGESTTSALIREVQEEAGVTLTPDQFQLAHTRHHYGDRSGVSFFFTCADWNGEFVNQEPHKCGGFTYFPLDNLPPNTVPYVAEVIKDIRNGITYSEGGWK